MLNKRNIDQINDFGQLVISARQPVPERITESLPPHSKRLKKEDQILNSAQKLIIQYGFDKTTVEEIAREAGVSKGAIYLHFPSKYAILDRLVERETRKVLEDLIQHLDADSRGYTVFNIYKFSVRALLHNPFLAAMYTRDRKTLGEYGTRLMSGEIGRAGMNFSTDFIRHFQHAGMIDPDVNPEVLGHIMTGLKYGLAGMSAVEMSPDKLEAISDLTGEMFQRAFGREDGDQAAAQAALKEMFAAGLSLLAQLQTEQKRSAS